MIEDSIEIGSGVGKHPVGGEVPRQLVGEEMTVAGQFRPRFDAGGDAFLDPVRLGEIAGRDPKAFNSETNQYVAVPYALVVREDLAKLFEGGNECPEQFVGGHSSRVPVAPGTSSVITCT